jgi:hypothetical protein
MLGSVQSSHCEEAGFGGSGGDDKRSMVCFWTPFQVLSVRTGFDHKQSVVWCLRMLPGLVEQHLHRDVVLVLQLKKDLQSREFGGPVSEFPGRSHVSGFGPRVSDVGSIASGLP